MRCRLICALHLDVDDAAPARGPGARPWPPWWTDLARSNSLSQVASTDLHRLLLLTSATRPSAPPTMVGKVEPAPPVPAPPLQAVMPLVLAAICGCLASWAGLEDLLAGLVPVAAAETANSGRTADSGQRASTAALCLVYYVAAFLGSRVVRARSVHRVHLPYMYPPPDRGSVAEVKDPAGFMAVVRGHENMLEALPFHTAAHLLLQLSPVGSPLHRPFTAAFGTCAFAVGRAWYAVGYSSEHLGPNGRLGGLLLSMLGTSTLWGELLRSVLV
jgi:hypothetical protein